MNPDNYNSSAMSNREEVQVNDNNINTAPKENLKLVLELDVNITEEKNRKTRNLSKWWY